jgi:hypothetical protein
MNCINTNVTLGCYAGTTIMVHTIDDGKGQPQVRFINGNGDVVVGATVANVTLGACSIGVTPPANVVVRSGGVNLAGAGRSATPAFAGAAATWSTTSVPGSLHSITIAAKAVLEGLPTLTADQIRVTLPNGNVYTMMNGETRTFSVVRDFDASLFREYAIACSGMAYANVTYTYI